MGGDAPVANEADGAVALCVDDTAAGADGLTVLGGDVVGEEVGVRGHGGRCTTVTDPGSLVGGRGDAGEEAILEVLEGGRGWSLFGDYGGRSEFDGLHAGEERSEALLVVAVFVGVATLVDEELELVSADGAGIVEGLTVAVLLPASSVSRLVPGLLLPSVPNSIRPTTLSSSSKADKRDCPFSSKLFEISKTRIYNVAGTRSLGLQLGRTQHRLFAFLTSDSNACADTIASPSGWIVWLAGGSIAWESRKRVIIADWTAEAE